MRRTSREGWKQIREDEERKSRREKGKEDIVVRENQNSEVKGAEASDLDS